MKRPRRWRACLSALTLEWGDLMAILEECAEAHNLPAIDRSLAQNAVVWLHTVLDAAPP